MWHVIGDRVLAACPPGVDPCNDGPSAGHSPLLLALVVVLVIAALACLIAVVHYLRTRNDL